METKLIFIFLALLFGLYNGYFNLWGLEIEPTQRARHSSSWHSIGFVIRASMALMATLLWGLFWGWIAVILLWHCFDAIIALVFGKGIFYTGTVSTFDKYAKLTWIAKGVWLLIGLYFLIW